MKDTISKVMGLVCLTLFSVVANAQQVNKEVLEAGENNAPSDSHVAHSGRMIVIDPETGEMASGKRQLELLGSTQLRTTGVAPVPRVASAPQLLENGMMKIELNGQFMIPVSVSLDEQGNLQKGHHIEVSHDHEEAK